MTCVRRVYRILRYTPDLLRDEWVNVGIVLEDVEGKRRRTRLIAASSELARIRRFHPDADDDLLRALSREFESYLSTPGDDGYLPELENTLSNVLQFSPPRAMLGDDFDAELDRLYRDYVFSGASLKPRSAILESAGAWARATLNDVFRRHQILPKLDKAINVGEFTQPGDPFRLDYAYRAANTRGFIHFVSLDGDPAQAKVLAYTAHRIRARIPNVEFAAVTEVPQPDDSKHEFIAKLLEDENIRIVPLRDIESFTDALRQRLN